MEKGAGASLRLFSCENEGTGMRSRTEAFGFSKVKDKRERGKNVLRKKSWLRPSEKKRNFAIKKNAPAQEGRRGAAATENGNRQRKKDRQRAKSRRLYARAGEIGGVMRGGEIGRDMRGASLNCQRRNTVSPSFIVRSTTISRSFSAGVRSGFPERRTRFSRFPAASVPVVSSSKY